MENSFILHLSSTLLVIGFLVALVLDVYSPSFRAWKNLAVINTHNNLKLFIEATSLRRLLYMFATWLKKKTCLHPVENVTEGWLVQDVRMRECEDCKEHEVSDPSVRTNHGFKVLKNCDPKYRPQTV